MAIKITEEQYRILRAARAGTLHRNEETLRWNIAGEAKPDNLERARLFSARLLEDMSDYFEATLTEKGWVALAELDKAARQADHEVA